MWIIVLAVLGLALGELAGGLAGAAFGAGLGYLFKRVEDLQGRVKALESERLMRQAAAPVAAPTPVAAEAAPEAAPEPEFEPGLESAPPPAALDLPPAPRQYSPPPSFAFRPGDWLSRLLAGNLLAKLGIVVLFFGVASGLRLVVEQGLLPPWLRLLGAALAGLAFIWAGAAPARGGAFRPAWLFRVTDMGLASRTGFGFALEGGGFGLLYLAVYFALARYGYLDPAVAFLLFAGLGLACVALALRQEGEALALLGLSGAFLAPALAGGEGRHLVLFAYVLLLDAVIVWAGLRRGWRPLILAGLGFSVLLGFAWADASYRPDLRADATGWVATLLALFSLAPVLAARRGEAVAWGWRSASLLFGPPAAAAVAYAALYDGDLAALALGSLLAGLWYGLLWQGSRRGDDALLGQALAGLALGFLSLSPYLAFSQNAASVFWALEGAGLVWYAQRQGRALPRLAGVLLQAGSGLLLWDLWQQGPDGAPFRNSLFHASVLLAAAGAFSAFALRARLWPGRLFLTWALAWWFGVWHWELGYELDDARRLVALLLIASFTFLASEAAGRRGDWRAPRAAAVLLLPLFAVVAVLTTWHTGHPLGANLWLVLPVALAVLYATLHRHERDGLDSYLAERHVLQFWAWAWIPAWEVHWWASRLPEPGASLPEALRGLLLALPILLVLRPVAVWPLSSHRTLYLGPVLGLPVLLAWAWLALGPIAHTGAWALPYLPVLNPLELAGLLLLWGLYRHWQAAGRFGQELGYAALFPLALLAWLTLALARAVHHWGGVPYLAGALWHSGLFQAVVSFAWTAFALAVLVLASRHQRRLAWFAGLGLLSVVGLKLLLVDLANVGGLLRVLSLTGIGALVLGAGYLAPVPPRKAG